MVMNNKEKESVICQAVLAVHAVIYTQIFS